MKKYLYIILAALLALGFSMGCDMPEEPGNGGGYEQQQQPPGQQPGGGGGAYN